MQFDFHHHHRTPNYKGIYNKSFEENFYSRYYSSGLHPQNIEPDWTVKIDQIYNDAKLPKILSIGECGLDIRASTPLEEQIKVFKSQIHIAEEVKKPLTIHCVRCFNEVIHICKNVKVPKVIHGFNKRKTIASSLLKNGFYLSFGTSLLKNLPLQNIFNVIPQKSFVLETDTSDISISNLYKKAAEIRNVSLKEMENIVYNNLKMIFRW